MQGLSRSQLRQTLRHLRLRWLCWFLQTIDSTKQTVRVQIQIGRSLRGQQDLPESVSSVPTQEMLRGWHEQGCGAERAWTAQLNAEEANGNVHEQGE